MKWHFRYITLNKIIIKTPFTCFTFLKNVVTAKVKITYVTCMIFLWDNTALDNRSIISSFWDGCEDEER